MTIIAQGPISLSGTCGASVVYSFQDRQPVSLVGMPSWYRPSPIYSLKDMNLHQGAGWLTAGFINTPACKEAYEILCSRYKVVIQTEKRRNNNSNNQFVFMVFDTKLDKTHRPRWTGKRKGLPKPQALIDWEAIPPTPIDNSSYKWPF